MPSYLHHSSSQSLFRLDQLFQYLQSGDYKHIMIGLKEMEGGSLEEAPKDEPSLNFPAFWLPEKTLKTPYYHRAHHFTDIWYASTSE